MLVFSKDILVSWEPSVGSRKADDLIDNNIISFVCSFHAFNNHLTTNLLSSGFVLPAAVLWIYQQIIVEDLNFSFKGLLHTISEAWMYLVKLHGTIMYSNFEYVRFFYILSCVFQMSVMLITFCRMKIGLTLYHTSVM